MCDMMLLKTDSSKGANIVLNNFPYWKFYNNVLYVFNFENGHWTTCKNQMNKTISLSFDNLHIVNQKGEKTGLNFAENHQLKETLYKYIKCRSTDENWRDNTYISSVNKLLFNDGWLDLKTKIFYASTEHKYNPDIVFTHAMLNNYSITEDYNKVYERKFTILKDYQGIYYENRKQEFEMTYDNGITYPLVKKVINYRRFLDSKYKKIP